jgi:hypothetical protein
MSALLVLLLTGCTPLTKRTALEGEHLANPGFEAVAPRDAAAPASWSLENFYGAPVQRIAVAAGEGRVGSRCIKIEPKARVAGLKSEVFEVAGGQRYEVSMWAKVLAPRGSLPPHPEAGRFDSLLGDVTLQTFSQAGALDIVGTRTKTRTWLDRRAREWTRVSTVFTVPPDAAFGVLYLRFNAGPDGFLVDDVSVRAAPPIPQVLDFNEREDFVTLTASREDGRLEDVYVSDDGVQLAEAPNFAPNPFLRFASGADRAPTNWTFAASEAYASCLPAAADQAAPFDSAAVLTRSDPVGWCEITSDPVTIDPREPYVVSVNYAFEGDGQPQLRLIGGDGQEHHQIDLFRRAAPYGWLREELRLHPGKWKGEKAKSARIAVRLYGSGTLKISGVVLRAGHDAGTATAPSTRARSGHLVSPSFEIGSVSGATVSWEASAAAPGGDSAIEVFSRVGPEPEHDPRTWTDWHPVMNGGTAFVPVRGTPLHMQFRVDLRADPKTGESPVLRSLRVERQRAPEPSDSFTEIVRLKEGFIDSRELLGGWQKFPPVDPDALALDRALMEYARDRATGTTSELDTIARVREHMMQHLVLFNAYNGGGPGSKGIELTGQGTGVGCGDVNALYGAALARLGILSRYVNLGGLDGSGHATVEVWSNELDKWILSDCFYGSVFIERDGIPLSLAEMFDLWRQDRMDEVVYAPWGAPSTLMFRSESHYTHGSSAPGPMRKRADSLLGEFVRYSGGPGVSLERDGFPVARAAPLSTVSGTPLPRHAIDYKLNQTVATIDFKEGDRATISLSHNMPGFDRFEVRFDPAGAWTSSPPTLDWRLREGHNHMQARAVNWAGVRGPAAEIGVRHWRVAALSASTPAVSGAKARSDQTARPRDWPADAVAGVPITVRAGLYERTDLLTEMTLPPEADAYEPNQLVEHTARGQMTVPFALADGRVQFVVPGKTPIMGERQFILYLRARGGPAASSTGSSALVPWKRSDPGWLDWQGALANGNAVFQAPKGKSDVEFEVLADNAKADTAQGPTRTLVIKNPAGKRVALLSEPFPIDPDVPMEVRFKARATAAGASTAKMMLRVLSDTRAELGYVAAASAGALDAEWKHAFFYGVTPSEAKLGQLRIDIDGEVAEIADVRVGPRAFPESGPATATAGPMQFR